MNFSLRVILRSYPPSKKNARSQVYGLARAATRGMEKLFCNYDFVGAISHKLRVRSPLLYQMICEDGSKVADRWKRINSAILALNPLTAKSAMDFVPLLIPWLFTTQAAHGYDVRSYHSVFFHLYANVNSENVTYYSRRISTTP